MNAPEPEEQKSISRTLRNIKRSDLRVPALNLSGGSVRVRGGRQIEVLPLLAPQAPQVQQPQSMMDLSNTLNLDDVPANMQWSTLSNIPMQDETFEAEQFNVQEEQPPNVQQMILNMNEQAALNPNIPINQYMYQAQQFQPPDLQGYQAIIPLSQHQIRARYGQMNAGQLQLAQNYILGVQNINNRIKSRMLAQLNKIARNPTTYAESIRRGNVKRRGLFNTYQDARPNIVQKVKISGDAQVQQYLDNNYRMVKGQFMGVIGNQLYNANNKVLKNIWGIQGGRRMPDFVSRVKQQINNTIVNYNKYVKAVASLQKLLQGGQEQWLANQRAGRGAAVLNRALKIGRFGGFQNYYQSVRNAIQQGNNRIIERVLNSINDVGVYQAQPGNDLYRVRNIQYANAFIGQEPQDLNRSFLDRQIQNYNQVF